MRSFLLRPLGFIQSQRMYQVNSCESSQNFQGIVVDLRSDTLTLPTTEMREAMFNSLLGDDVFGECPTTKGLEKRVATLLGKESGLFVPSGTMSNLLAVMTHCNERGSEMFLGDKSHIFLYEQGGSSHLAGVHPSILPNLPDGTFDVDLLVSRIRGDDPHEPRSKLICIENSHNFCGGKALPIEWLEKVWAVSKNFNIPVHIDGARLLNTAFYFNVDPKKLTEGASSVSFCLSKGIGSPVGSVLVGSSAFIQQARRFRKALGGGMRQCGVLAAAADFALNGVEERIKQDHNNAKLVVQAISQKKSPNVLCDIGQLHTNIILVHLNEKKLSAEDFVKRLGMVSLKEQEQLQSTSVIVKCLAISLQVVRIVLHCNISSEATQKAIDKIKFVIDEIDGKF